MSNHQSELISAQLDLDPDLQYKKLLSGLDPSHVSKKQGFSYVEGCQVISSANEIFGFGMWSTFFDLIEKKTIDIDKNGKKGWKTSVVMKVKVEVTMAMDRRKSVHEDVGLGFATSYKDELETLDSAYKEAKTDGIKRCLRHMGNQFGNSLYFKANPVHDGQPDSEGWDEDKHQRLLRELTNAKNPKEAFEAHIDVINQLGGKTKTELRRLYKSLT